MQVKCPNSIEYRVEAEGGRIYSWSAVDMDSLFRELTQKNIRAKNVKPLSEYEAEIMAREEQERLMDEHHRQYEEDVRKSA